ncbi:hypothetical protein QL285_024323 [Trifolium repens]|nr:hypothetical protein QL285_024323 [Trifolium repens]
MNYSFLAIAISSTPEAVHAFISATSSFFLPFVFFLVYTFHTLGLGPLAPNPISLITFLSTPTSLTNALSSRQNSGNVPSRTSLSSQVTSSNALFFH